MIIVIGLLLLGGFWASASRAKKHANIKWDSHEGESDGNYTDRH